MSATANPLGLMDNSPDSDCQVSCAGMSAPSAHNISRPAVLLLEAGIHYEIDPELSDPAH